MKIASAIRTEATYSEEDLLRIENEFLRDELDTCRSASVLILSSPCLPFSLSRSR